MRLKGDQAASTVECKSEVAAQLAPPLFPPAVSIGAGPASGRRRKVASKVKSKAAKPAVMLPSRNVKRKSSHDRSTDGNQEGD